MAELKIHYHVPGGRFGGFPKAYEEKCSMETVFEAQRRRELFIA